MEPKLIEMLKSHTRPNNDGQIVFVNVRDAKNFIKKVAKLFIKSERKRLSKNF